MPGQPGRYGQRGRVHGPHLRRPLAAAVVPVEREPERILHLGRRRPGEARRPGTHGRVGGEAVDVVAGQARVGDGGQAGLDREIEVGAAQPPPDVGLADARDDGPAFQGLLDRAHDAAAGVKSGIHTSS